MKLYHVIIVIALLHSCAQTTPLKGGPKDTHAPSIDSAKSVPYNGQTNYTEPEVKLKFDEYIKLFKATENILIIPQQQTPSSFEVRNKKLTIYFNEDLRENTTYTITFNGAVQDITEKNDSVFQYVFSTGDYIDSLELKGNVKDAFTNKPMEEMLVGMYPTDFEANFDSIPIKFKPTYLTQTDKAGNFKLNYLKGGNYYLFAIKDQNKNLIFDPSEEIALLAQRDFILAPDSVPEFQMRAFHMESDEVEIDDINFQFPGRLDVILTNPSDSFSISSDMPLLQEDTGVKDSLVFWLEKNPVSKMKFYTELNGEKDTVKPIYSKVPDKIEDVKLTYTNNVKKGKILPNKNLQFTFSEPVGTVDMNVVKFFDADSNQIQLDSFEVDIRTLEFKTFYSKAHQITIDSAAIKSVYGRELQEEITLYFDSHLESYYGSLIVSMDTTFDVPVIMHLLDSKQQLIDSASFAKKLTFEKLLPGDYQLRLIFDVDNNGKWTSGSLSEGKEPEKVIYNTEIVQVKSKWEKEIDWILTVE